MNRSRFIPQVEQLHSRLLPSATSFAHLAEPPAALVASPVPLHFKHPLAGKGSGVYSTDFIPTDTGTTYHFHGSARLAGLGEVQIRGSLSSVGFTASGRARGTLTFLGNGGLVTVELQGPVQPGFSHLPHYFHYRIVRATGSYLHLAGSGTLRLDLHPLPTGALGERGSFSLWI
jgi:hypothetical protein